MSRTITCVCGGSTDKPNPDCERCQLVAENDRLRARVSQLTGHLDWLGWGSDEVGSAKNKLEQELMEARKHRSYGCE